MCVLKQNVYIFMPLYYELYRPEIQWSLVIAGELPEVCIY